MAPLSKLPGRLRVEIREIIGRKNFCRVLELRIMELTGVIEAEANSRTGRLLVIFDKNIIDSRELLVKIRDIIDDMNSGKEHDEAVHGKRTRTTDTGHQTLSAAFVHAAIDIAGHLLMPKPLGFLIPLAVNAMRKSL